MPDAIRLPDGRALAWFEWGPLDGVPVIFCTGAAMCGSLAFGVDHLHDLGLRLLAIDRPGLGASDPHPSKTLLTWIDDVRALISANNLHHVSAVGFSQGAPFALALASHNLVRTVAIVSGQDELSHPSMLPLLHADVAAMIARIQNDPAAFEQSFSQIATKDGLWNLILTMSSPHDRAVYTDPVFNEVFQRSLTEGFSQGPQGYVRDLVNTFSPWPFSVEQIATPIDLWYGRLDMSTVHSPDFGVTLNSRLPQSTLTVEPAEGGSLLWTRSRQILETLKSRL